MGDGPPGKPLWERRTRGTTRGATGGTTRRTMMGTTRRTTRGTDHQAGSHYGNVGSHSGDHYYGGPTPLPFSVRCVTRQGFSRPTLFIDCRSIGSDETVRQEHHSGWHSQALRSVLHNKYMTAWLQYTVQNIWSHIQACPDLSSRLSCSK